MHAKLQIDGQTHDSIKCLPPLPSSPEKEHAIRRGEQNKTTNTHTHTPNNSYKIITYNKTSDECQCTKVDNARIIVDQQTIIQ